MSKVLVEGILFETEEIPPITKDNIEQYELVSQDESGIETDDYRRHTFHL